MRYYLLTLALNATLLERTNATSASYCARFDEVAAGDAFSRAVAAAGNATAARDATCVPANATALIETLATRATAQGVPRLTRGRLAEALSVEASFRPELATLTAPAAAATFFVAPAAPPAAAAPERREAPLALVGVGIFLLMVASSLFCAALGLCVRRPLRKRGRACVKRWGPFPCCPYALLTDAEVASIKRLAAGDDDESLVGGTRIAPHGTSV